MFQSLVEIQRDIYLAFAGYIKLAADGDWRAFAAYLPMGVVFGAVHAITPGHSKAVLATYVTGSSSGMVRALSISMALSFTHVTMAVLIGSFPAPRLGRPRQRWQGSCP